jgi:hypothetical protein
MAVQTRSLVSAAALIVSMAVVSPATLEGQSTSTGTLTVSATIEASVALTFESDPSGVALSGSGTSAATLALGTVSAYGTIGTAGVTRTVGASDFTVSSPFGARVDEANSTSASYTLAVALAASDPTNTWRVNSTTLTTSNQTLGSSYGYGSAVAHVIYLTVPFSASAGAVSRVLNFTATAN